MAPHAFGTATEGVVAFNALSLLPYDVSSASRLLANGIQRFCSAPCNLTGSLNLPSGALITGLEIDGFDIDASGAVIAFLDRCPAGATVCSTLVSVSTGGAAAPGAIRVRGDLPSPHTVDNGANTYVLFMSSNDPETRFMGLRVFFRLQVTPAPAVATFGDVPVGHPQHQYIEALVASGITAGCGNGNYCPDAPLTRGQMAVFLSKGLGLHFAP